MVGEDCSQNLASESVMLEVNWACQKDLVGLLGEEATGNQQYPPGNS